MRQIKFRGRFWNMDGHDASECENRDGDIIYGGYARMKLEAKDGYEDYIINEFGIAYLVYPESVAQLVGVDKNGREVYEGDTLKRFDELDADDTLSATFEDYGDILNGTLILAEAQS